MSTATRRLAAVDEANLTLDHRGQVNVFLIAGLLSPGGFIDRDGIPDMSWLRSAISSRVDKLPSLRQVPFRVGRRHAWGDVLPDLEHHVRLIRAVDGLPGLARACADLMNVPLALDRPLWELLIAPGATTDGIGMVLRIHHAIADGIAAVALVQELFQEGAPVMRSPATVDRAPRQTSFRDAWRVVRRARVGLRRIHVTLRSHEVGPTVLLGTRSAVHGVEFLDADLPAVESHARRLGATLNDALLCAVAAGYRATLPAVGEPIPEWLPVSVPVALKRRDTSANQVGVMLVRLPLGESDPDRRLRLIAGQTQREKPQAREQGTLELMRGPIGARIMDRVGQRQHLVAGFVTNVPGPSGVLRLSGAPVVAMWPVAVLAANVRSGVAAASYGGRLWCGVHFDAANIPGSAFAEAMAEEFSHLAR